jgi:mRNA-degrading endonuclease RelE of RelBE toxin-antitoxin system
MKSTKSQNFNKLYYKLPKEIKELTNKCYLLWRTNPQHPSLHYKKLSEDFRSVRIGDHFRAIARIYNDNVIWSWIGTHEEYNNLIKSK